MVAGSPRDRATGHDGLRGKMAIITDEEILERYGKNHEFVGDGKYCKHWNESVSTSSLGVLTFRSQCGFPRKMHKVQVKKEEEQNG